MDRHQPCWNNQKPLSEQATYGSAHPRAHVNCNALLGCHSRRFELSLLVTGTQTSVLDLRSADSSDHLFLLFSFQFSFFLCTKLGFFLMFPFAFIFFSLITHIYFSLLENDLRRTAHYLIGYYQYSRTKSILLSAILKSWFISICVQDSILFELLDSRHVILIEVLY